MIHKPLRRDLQIEAQAEVHRVRADFFTVTARGL
jgi:hypothetical protein